MSYKDWYTINEDKSGNFLCVAVDKDLNFVKQYKIDTSPGSTSLGNCECFAGHTWCRHKKMVALFRQKGFVGSRKYHNFDRNKWMEQPSQEI
jgi:hypothetical protein